MTDRVRKLVERLPGLGIVGSFKSALERIIVTGYALRSERVPP